MIEKDIYDSDGCKEMIKGHFLKIGIINKFVEILKIKNTFDIDTIIKRDDIELLIPYIEKNRKKISTIFDFDDTVKDKVDEKYKYKSFFPYIERCITNWSGCYFTIDKKDSHTKKPISYKLSGMNFYDLIRDKKIETKNDFQEFIEDIPN
jgi:nitrogenase molybdenum-iron protein alpha/beta subunit